MKFLHWVALILSELNRKRPAKKDEKSCDWFVTEDDLPGL